MKSIYCDFNQSKRRSIHLGPINGFNNNRLKNKVLLQTKTKMQTALQRPTDDLQYPDTRQEIQSLYNAAYAIDKGRYTQGSKIIDSFLKERGSQMQQKKYDMMGLQMIYNLILSHLYEERQDDDSMKETIQKSLLQFESLLKEIKRQEREYLQEEQEEWIYAQNLKIRIYTTLLQLSIRSEKVESQLWLNQLLDSLELYPGHIPEVLGKLCGCKNLKSFSQNFNSDTILANTQYDFPKKAQLIELASTWIILAGNIQKGSKLKELSLLLWKKSNRLKQSEKCQVQLIELKSNPKSQYCMKIKKLARFTMKILEILEDTQLPKKIDNIGLIVKNGMHYNLQKINLFDQKLEQIEEQAQKAGKKKSFWSSSKKSLLSTTKKSLMKGSKLLQYYGKSNEFYDQVLQKEINDEITSLLVNDSKFILDQKKKLSKLILPLIQLYTKKRRYAFSIIKNCYIVKFGVLNPSFLSKLAAQKSRSPDKKQ